MGSENGNCQGCLFIKVVIIVMGVALTACGTEPDCTTSGSSIVKVGFARVNSQPDTVFVENDTLIFNRVYALGNEDSLIVESDTLTFLRLPLKPNAGTTTFVMENKRKGATTDFEFDTISFDYQIGQRLISPDCGVEVIYKNLQVNENYTFDMVFLINNELNRDPDANIEIFR